MSYRNGGPGGLPHRFILEKLPVRAQLLSGALKQFLLYPLSPNGGEG
jgi:hypothetical protein